MKRAALVIFALSMAAIGHAQTYNEGFINQPVNIRYGSHNPTRSAYNTVRDFAVANVSYSLSDGDFHAVDESGNSHGISAYIGGMRHIGKFDVKGHLGYHNRQENDQSWNSTLWLLPYNPFVLCDSVAGDVTSEWFDMSANAVYRFTDRLNGGIEIGLRTGNRSDQTDPRPRTATSIVPITAGADYQINQSWNIGASAGLRWYSSVIEYTKAASFATAHRYFLMKGMGDYAKRSSGDEPGYKRDYQGTSFTAAASATWQPAGGQMSNFIEVSASSNRQDATDGGVSYSFHGGDYKETVMALQDRLMWRPDNHTLHNLTIAACYASGKATWYDQKRELDFEHGSAILYRILNKSTIQESKRLTAGLHYQLDMMKNGQRDLLVNAGVNMESITRKQYLGAATPTQKIQAIDLTAEVGKAIYINKVSLLAQIGGGYRLPCTKEYANGSNYTEEDDISQSYTRRVFEYETASRMNIHMVADVSMPAGKQLVAGAYIKSQFNFYTDDEEFWKGYDGKSMTTAEAGFYLKF